MKKLILSETHEKLGGKMVDFSGCYMPVQYEGIRIEHQIVRESVGVFDVSHMGEIFVNGENATEYLQYITSNDVENLMIGQVQYTCFPNNSGGIVDDLLLYKMEEQDYMLVVNASNIEKDLNWMISHNKFGVVINNRSEEYSLLAVQGPKSIELLEQLTDINLSAMKYYNYKIGTLAGVKNTIISRTGYTGEVGFELYVRNTEVKMLWDKLFSTPIRVRPIGLAARDTLRLEKGFCLYGNDINDTTSPIEAGLGWITKFSKQFINSENLLKQKREGTSRKLVGIELLEKGIARKDYTIVNNQGVQIGVITSGTMSPTLNKSIAMGYVNIGYQSINSEIFIEIRNNKIKSRVVRLPFLK